MHFTLSVIQYDMIILKIKIRTFY